MNKLNPLYILVLVFTILVISFIKLEDLKNNYNTQSSYLSSFDSKAKLYNEHKKTWFNEKNVAKKIDIIIKSSVFKNEKILKTQNKNFIKIKIESPNPRILDKFLNRVLNEKFLIKKLDIKKRSILMEIGFK